MLCVENVNWKEDEVSGCLIFRATNCEFHVNESIDIQ